MLVWAAENTVRRAPPPTAAKARPYVELWLAVRVNETVITEPARMLRLPGGRLLASADDLLRWRLRPPAVPPLTARGRDYLPLDALPGLEFELDEPSQTLLIRARPEAFPPTVLNAATTRYTPPDKPSSGALLNYDLQWQRVGRNQRLDGLVELGLFNPWGFGTSTFLGHGLQGGTHTIRLETTWTHDQPLGLWSLRIGDGIGRSGSWGRAVRFGGMQWGSNFALRPEFVPFAQPTLAGEAALPSTVDLYVNNALRLSSPVPPGPFSIPDVPVITGAGEVRLVVRDLLGRQTVINQPYYASAQLLRPGQHDYSYEAGWLRRNFGFASADYGAFFAAGTHRYGLGEVLTGEVRAEAMAAQQTLGATATGYWPALGTISASAAWSRGESGRGGLVAAGVDRQGRPLGFSLHGQFSSARFTQLGASEHLPPPRRLVVAGASLALGAQGAVFASLVDQAAHRGVGSGQPDARLLSAGYNVGLPGHSFLSVFAVQSLRGTATRSIGLSLTRALGPRTTASAGLDRQRGALSPTVQLQQSLPQHGGLGYRLLAALGPQRREDAALQLQNERGAYGIELQRTDAASGLRVSAAGGAAWLGGGLHLSRRIDDSFAVVKVGAYPDVPVYANNHEVARTDARGMALVPTLHAYQTNPVSIQQDALPMDAQIDLLALSVTPRRRSGSLVEFPVRAAHGALLRIVLEDGSPLPAGAIVTLKGRRGEEFPVARRGEAYVTGLARDNELQAAWKGRRCPLAVALPADAAPLPVLGPLVCRGVLP